jgi:hypothetical protein
MCVVGDGRTQNLRRIEMTFGADCKAAFLRHALVAAVGLALLAACGCKSGAKSNGAEQSSSDQNGGAAAPDSAGTQIDTNCIGDRIQNPPEAFHYTFKKVDGPNVHDEEADITPQTIDGTVKNNNGAPFTFHILRSDKTNWDGALLNLSGAVGMLTASASIISNSSAMVREGTGKVNGYDATTYSIDTARGNADEKGGYELLLGQGGSAKGTTSVTAQGCPVKLLLDEEVHQLNGSVDKVHLEMAMIRK